MDKVFLPAKLLMVLVERGHGIDVVDASKRGGARGGTKLLGRGSEIFRADLTAPLEFYGQDIVMIVMRNETDAVLDAVIQGSFDRETGYSGAAVLLDVPKTFIRPGLRSKNAVAAPHISEGEHMQSGYTMISSIINYGQAEELMAVARAAGARGGTILSARGTGKEDDVSFFGISLISEKELLVIIAENAHADAILEALSSQPVFSEPGGGIIFTTAVDQLISLGD